MNTKSFSDIWPAIGVAALVSAARWVLECGFVVPLVPDPQSPIWIMFSTITSAFIFATVYAAALVALRALKSNQLMLRVVACLPLLGLLAWYSTGFVYLAKMRAALMDSENPKASAERLRELARFRGGPGYEIDNRVASNPSTPPDVLRSLHGRPDQVGTEMCLAENPNTPDDVLRSLAARHDDWAQDIKRSLKRNPRYQQVFNAEAPEDRGPAEPSDAADSR
jgi:hypothetical protein